jgi:hypothetical protein
MLKEFPECVPLLAVLPIPDFVEEFPWRLWT